MAKKKSQVEDSIAGEQRDPMAKAFLKRAEKQQKIVAKYKNYTTDAMKLKCLHEIASSFTLCFADCEEDYYDKAETSQTESNWVKLSQTESNTLC